MDVLLIMAVGFVMGVPVGRWWAETRRGMYDRKGAWEGRKKYRGGK